MHTIRQALVARLGISTGNAAYATFEPGEIDEMLAAGMDVDQIVEIGIHTHAEMQVRSIFGTSSTCPDYDVTGDPEHESCRYTIGIY